MSSKRSDPPPPATPGLNAQLAQAQAQADAGRYRQAVDLFDAALAGCSATDDSCRARVLTQQAQLLARLGDMPAAARHASQALGLAETRQEHAVQAQALSVLCFIYAQSLMGSEALQCGLRALALARRAAAPELEGWALNRMGAAYASLDNPAQACDTTRQALEIAERHGLEELAFSSLNNLAYFWLQRVADAQRDQEPAALAQARAQARSLAERACGAARASSNAFRVAVALSNLAEAMLANGELGQLPGLIDEYEALSRTHGYRDLALQARTQRALILRAEGHRREALTALQQLLALEDPRLPPKLHRLVVRTLYETHKSCGDYREALERLEQLGELERQVSRDMLTLQTELTLIRREVEQAQARAEHALRDAARERERAGRLERERQHLREEAAALGRAAHEDVLTGLHNRRHAEPALMLLVEGARLAGQPLMLALLDVDHFKNVNDTLGHAAGDLVLQELAQLLRKSLRGADLLARVGGEEFLVAMVGIAPEQALEICERLRHSVAAHDWSQIAAGLAVTISVGLTGGRTLEDARHLQQRADRALYAAKNEGRNRVSVG